MIDTEDHNSVDITKTYRLEEQVGFVLRQVSQRHSQIFAQAMIEDLTPTQFAVLAKLHDEGAVSQNHLGRMTAMDVATIKGVVDRLVLRGFALTMADVTDARRRLIVLTEVGKTVADKAILLASQITEETLEPLSADERIALLSLLKRLR